MEDRQGKGDKMTRNLIYSKNDWNIKIIMNFTNDKGRDTISSTSKEKPNF